MSLLRHGNPVLPARRCGGGARQFGGGFRARRTNSVANGGFETNTTGWSADVSRVLASSEGLTAKHGDYIGKTTTGSGANQSCSGFTVAGLSAGIIYTVQRWFYRSEASAQLTFRVRNAANNGSLASQDIPLSVGWHFLTLTFTADGTSHIVNVNRVPASVIEFYTDAFQFEAGTFATPYIATDGATKTRVATRHG